MAGAIREAIWSIDSNSRSRAIFTFDESVSRALARPRLVTVLLALVRRSGTRCSAPSGSTASLAFLVQQRRSEIGVRIAPWRAAGRRRGFVRAPRA